MPPLRIAVEGDAQVMGEVFHAAGAAAWGHFISVEALKAEPVKPEMFLQHIREPQAVVRVADPEQAGEGATPVAGFVITRRSADEGAGPDTGELHMCYVHPDAWGSGIASTLMASALADLRGAGYQRATLWTAEANHRPRAFYERHGWTLDGARRSKTRLGSTFTELRYAIDVG